MYIIVDDRSTVTESYVSSFSREGFSSFGLGEDEFKDWIETASDQDLAAVEGFLLGDFERRPAYPDVIRTHSRAPILALSDQKCLTQTLELFTAGIDDVVRKPVHVREIVARTDAIWRRVNSLTEVQTPATGRLKVFFDGRDAEIDGEPLPLPRRERHILEYLVKNARKRVTKTQIFNTIYGIFNDDVDESVVEGHMSKLRKKLRMKLGYDVIDAKRYLGYQFVG
ncbi:response regulator transcription factor [Ancylobacter sp. WKF20]|uniref:response regulator transcription factor n=1 Tax=Ancylobacter sp. WKF20 TaxID=3039801 RepID=UPI002434260C|nr:response regulator transcription factor [Ancylobacter sp. WKF20]WGD28605.1 response regulator transcription factor [Ancylobacter sp. WKF20]